MFDSPAKTTTEIEQALELGISFNVDNFEELARVDQAIARVGGAAIGHRHAAESADRCRRHRRHEHGHLDIQILNRTGRPPGSDHHRVRRPALADHSSTCTVARQGLRLEHAAEGAPG